MNPYDNAANYTSIVLGSTRSPGKVTLSGHDRTNKWDVKEPKGSTGATSVLNGEAVGSFEATFYLADAAEVDAWESFQRLIESTTSGPEPVALPVYHPDLARNRYTEVCNGGVGGLVYDRFGGATVKVKFQEHRPPKPKPAARATAAPNGTTGANATQPYDPNREARAELGRLLEEAAAP